MEILDKGSIIFSITQKPSSDHDTWWRHQMETFSVLLAICAGNSPPKGQWRGALMFSFIFAPINGWVNNRDADDLRRHRTHYDVIVMILPLCHWQAQTCCCAPSIDNCVLLFTENSNMYMYNTIKGYLCSSMLIFIRYILIPYVSYHEVPPQIINWWKSCFAIL